MKLTPYHFEELVKQGYSLDQIYLLSLIYCEFDVVPMCTECAKMGNILQSIIRKGLITESEHKITTIGQELIQFMTEKAPGKIIKHKPSTTEFEEWWKAYPGTDTFVYKSDKFSGSRSLRQDKDNCRIKFNKIILEGEYTAAQLIEAMKYDVTQKKENSVKTHINKLSYMQNSLTYLNQRSYEPFIELINAGQQIEEAPKITGSTDI